MVGTEASIPKGMCIGDDVDVVGDSISDGTHIMGVEHEQVLHHLHHAKRKEIHVSLTGISGSIHISHFNLMNEASLRRIYTLAWPIMNQWRLSFFIYVYLENPFHLQITPTVNYLFIYFPLFFQIIIKIKIKGTYEKHLHSYILGPEEHIQGRHRLMSDSGLDQLL
jgi:hypothetical protein